MILLIGKDNKVEKFIEESKFSELGIWERTHMEEWISKYPQILGEDLLTITTEYAKFDKTNNRLDILAIDTDGKIVVIELKRDTADKFVDLQAIHYAAYCSTLNYDQIVQMMVDYKKESKELIESEIKSFILNGDFSDFDNQPRIMLVANDFREETLAAVLWLRESGIDITCVKLEPYKIEGKIAINSEIILPLPEAKDFIIQVDEKKKTTSRNDQYKKNLYQFWSRVLKEFKAKKPGLTEEDYVSTPWLLLYTGYKNIHFEWYFRRRPVGFFVSIHFETSDNNKNKELCKYFRSKSDVIQNQFPDDKIIFGKYGSIATQVFAKRDSVEFDDENLKWGVETMIKLYDVLKPILDDYFKDRGN